MVSGFTSVHENGSEIKLNVGPLFNFARLKLACMPKIQGYLIGLHADCTLMSPRCFYTSFIFDGRWNAGSVCGDQDTKAQIKDYRPQWWFGYAGCTSQSVGITPFTGLGFYYVSHELKPDVIQYQYYNFFVPFGVLFNWSTYPDEFSVGLTAWYRPDLWTQAKVTTPCLVECTSEKIKLNHSQGVHVELPMSRIWTFNECTDIHTRLAPFFDWNRFGRVDEVNCNSPSVQVPFLDKWYLGLYLDIGIYF